MTMYTSEGWSIIFHKHNTCNQHPDLQVTTSLQSPPCALK